MKKHFIFISILIAALVVFASCGSSEKGNESTAEPSGNVTAEPTSEPATEATVTPEPTQAPTPTPVPEPGTYDLMCFDAEEGQIMGDGWDVIPGFWAGPLCEPVNAPEGATIDGTAIYGHREVAAVTLSNGEIGAAVRLAIDGEEGQRWLGNRFGIEECDMKPNTKYKVIATFRLSGSNVDGSKSVLGYADGMNDPDYYVEIKPAEEWQTATCYFTTGKTIEGGNIVLGPQNRAGHCNYDYELLIEKCEIYEIVGETQQEDAEDILGFKANNAHVSWDGWSVLEGKFAGPCVAPQAGTEGEALENGVIKYATRDIFNTTLSDGSDGMVLRHALIADEGYRHSGNFYGISDIGLKGNTTYVLTVLLKFTGNTIDGYIPVVGFTCNAESLNPTESITDFVELEAKDEWQTVTLEFTTPEEVKNPVILVGPNSFIGKIEAGYCMYIENMRLAEKKAE